MEEKKEVKLSTYAPVRPYVDILDVEEQQVVQELDTLLDTAQNFNQLIHSQQETLDQLVYATQHTTAHVEDGVKANMEAEKERAEGSKIKFAMGGAILGAIPSVVAPIVAPFTSAGGGFLGWQVGKAVGNATKGAVEKEYDALNKEGKKEKKQFDGSFDEKSSGKSKSQKIRDDLVFFVSWENQRYTTFSQQFSAENLLQSDPEKWTTKIVPVNASENGFGLDFEKDFESEGFMASKLNPETTCLPEFAYEWEDQWLLVKPDQKPDEAKKRFGTAENDEGFFYAPNWKGPWSADVKWNSYVRRRKWIRPAVLKQSQVESSQDLLTSPLSISENRRGLLEGKPDRLYDPNEKILQRMGSVKEAVGSGSHALYHQGQQVRGMEKETDRQKDALEVNAKIRKMSSFHNVIISYLTPSSWRNNNKSNGKGGVEDDQNPEDPFDSKDKWEFEGQDPTMSEQMMMEGEDLQRMTKLMSHELNAQNRVLDRVSEKQDINAKKLKKQTDSIQKELN